MSRRPHSFLAPRLLAPLVALGLLTACGGEDPAVTDAPPLTPPTQVEAPAPDAAPMIKGDQEWAVASANPLATEAGAQILRAGGTAVDAAVAVQAVLGLAEPQSSGLGGGAFMLHYEAATGELTSFDGREVAPASATPDMFLLEDGTRMGFYDAVTSGKSVGVPGAVAMLAETHARYGKTPWADLFTEAERLATEGFPLSPRLHGLLGRMNRLPQTAAAKDLYYLEDGTPKPAGSLFKNPEYATTVRQIARQGADAFYTGTIAQQIVDAVNAKAGDGTMTLADMAAYTPAERAPVCGAFLAYEICSMAPPSSGGVTVLQILGLVDARLETIEQNNEGWTTYAEASRLAYADRDLYLGDPDSMGGAEATADQITQGLVAPAYLKSRSDLIDERGAAAAVEPGDPLTTPLREGRAPDASPNLPGTSHFSVRDSFGNIVSMTTTVETAFGSHLMAGGMILNNQLTDFSFLPTRDGVPVVNAVAPGKTPRSSMAPVIVLNDAGEPVMAIGSPGGPAIIGYVAKTLLASLAWDLPLQDAIDLPHVVTPRGSLLVEEGAPDALLDAFKAFGMDVTQRPLTSGLYGFRITAAGLEPGADGRREGTYQSGQ